MSRCEREGAVSDADSVQSLGHAGRCDSCTAVAAATQSHVLLQHDYFLSDLHHSHLPIRAFIGREIAQGSVPLWWPEVFSGVPLWAQIEGSVLWFPQWIAYGLMEPYVAFNVLTCFHVLLSAVGSFLLGRACGLSGAGAALAGVVFGLCGFNIAHLRNPNLHSAAAMVPWVLWASRRPKAA